MKLTDEQVRDVRFRAEVAGDADVLALVEEVTRTRTITGDPGRVGYEARAYALGGYVNTGFPQRVPIAVWDILTPNNRDAWVAAGQAERAVAYTLAADLVSTAGAPAVTSPLAERIRELAHPATTAAERMARLSALLREAGALAGAIASDVSAPAELRVSAEAIHRGVFGDGNEACIGPPVRVVHCALAFTAKADDAEKTPTTPTQALKDGEE